MYAQKVHLGEPALGGTDARDLPQKAATSGLICL
jgi:hypothetical protein